MKSTRGVARAQYNVCRHQFVGATRAAVMVISAWAWLACCYPVSDALAEVENITIDMVLNELPMPDTAKQRILKGDVVEWTTEEASDRELSVGVALFVKERPKGLAKFFRQAILLKIVESITGYGEIKGKGTLADFSGVVLEPNGEKEAEGYLNAEPGESLNLSAEEIAAFRALNGDSLGAVERKKKVEELVRVSLLARYQAYRAKGLSGIAPYERGGGDQRLPAEELVGATKMARFVVRHVPSAHQVILEYPSIGANDIEEWYYWVNIEVFGRPTFILSHRMLGLADNSYLGVERHFYASHDYNTLQALSGVVPTKGGALLVYINRVSTEQVGGFGSSVKHPVARGLMTPYVKAMFEGVRSLAEKE